MEAVRHAAAHHAFAVGSIWADLGPYTQWIIVDVVQYQLEHRTRHDICFRPYDRSVLRPWRTKWLADTTVLKTMEYQGFDEAIAEERRR